MESTMTKRNRSRPGLERLEDRQVLSTITSVAEFPTPTPSADPTAITSGPDGNLWFVENFTGGSVEKIGTLNLKTHVISEFKVPSSGANVSAIVSAPDGNLWFTERGTGKLGMINPTTHVIKEFKTPNVGPEGIAVGSDGNLWFTGGYPLEGIAMMNVATHVVTTYPIAGPSGGNYTWGIAAGSDGNLWFTQGATAAINEFNPTTHVATQFTLPPTSSRPLYITSGSDGNLWFTDYGDNSIETFNPKTDVLSVFPIPTPKAYPRGITSGPDGNLWFTEYATGNIGSINPTTHVITEYAVGSGQNSLSQITTGPDGNLWFTAPSTSSVGVATLSATPKAPGAQHPAIALPLGSAEPALTPASSTFVPLVLEDGAFLNSLVKNKSRRA